MKRSMFAIAFATLWATLLPAPAEATTYTWIPLSGATYNWDDTNNWAGMVGSFPNAAGDVVVLSVNISGAQSINLNGNRTLGSLTIGDTDYTHLFTINGGSSLIFDNGGNPATITKVPYVTLGCCTVESIDSNITLASDLNMTNNSSYGWLDDNTLRLGGGISGIGGITKLGTGPIAIGGGTANTYAGPTIVKNGPLWIAADDSIPDTSPVDIIATGAGAIATLSVGYPGKFLACHERIGPLRFGGTTTTSEARIELCGTLFLAGDVTYDATNTPKRAWMPSHNCAYNVNLKQIVDLEGAVRTFNIAHSSTNLVSEDLTIEANIINGGIVKEGPGGLHFSGFSSTFSGGVVIKNGYFKAWNAGAGTGTITIGDTSGSNSTQFVWWPTSNIMTNTVVVPGGNTGTATLALSGNSWAPITIGSGALSPHDLILMKDGGAQSASSASWGGAITGHGNLTVVNVPYINDSNYCERAFLSGGTINSVGSLSFTGMGRSCVDAAIGSNVTGVIVNMSNAYNHFVRIYQNQTYPAPTTVTSGTLLLDGAHTGGAPYTIAPAGILAGTGSTNAAVSLSGTIAPGAKYYTGNAFRAAPGKLSIGPSAWSNGVHFAFDIDKATGTAGVGPGWDLLDVNGALDISGIGAGGLTIDVKSLVTFNYLPGDASNFNNQLDYAWPLVTFDSLVGTFNASQFVINSSDFTNPTGGGTFGIRQNGNSLELTFTAVAVCGNGFVSGSEACDDGNSMSGDGCDASCKKEFGQTCSNNAQCGSGFCDSSGNMCACDDDADCPMGQNCNLVSNPNVCVIPSCGNSLIDPGETCDDGNQTNGDGCDVNCQPTGCGNGIVTSGEGCDDGNTNNGDGCDAGCLFELGRGCLLAATCSSGFCVDGVCCEVASCFAMDQCHDAGTCQTGTGLCSNPGKTDGSSCNDSDACTQSDTCQAGTCMGANPVTCLALDQCHEVGACNPATGMCSDPKKMDGSSCNDGDACTPSDTCQSGTCTGENPVGCSAIDECHVAGTCNSMTGLCSMPPKADGTPCTNNGTCQIGVCIPRCLSNADCPDLFECIEQRCYPLTEGPLASANGCACSAAGENGSSNQTHAMTLVALGAAFARRRMKRRSNAV